MSRKSKGVVFDEDAKARLKHQTLLQDYEELQKEADVMRSRLEEAKQRKVILAAEVGFLRRRYKHLVRTKPTNSSSQEQNLVQMPNMLKKPKIGKAASKRRLPLIKESNSKKKLVKQVAQKRSYSGKESKGHSPISDLNPKGILHIRKESLHPNTTPVLDRNEKGSVLVGNESNLRNSAVAFDLNQDSTQEASLPTLAPTFDLNISTWDEDYVDAIKYEEATNSFIKSVNISEEQQSDLKLSICRNAGESSSRPGKRKISWQDPVALRV
ncbi:hypothetical protein ACS0TY_024316 [Phlomoides rotata]